MPALANPLEQLAVALIAGQVVAGTLACQHRLKVVEHQQAALPAQVFQQQSQLLVFISWQFVRVMM